MARRCGARGDEIDEVVQDALLVLVTGATSLRADAALAPWLAAIVRHRVATLLRRKRRLERLHVVDSAAVDRAGGATHDAFANTRGREVLEAVERALTTVSPAYQECLRLHLFEGLAPWEVAKRLGMNRVTVRLRLFRGLRQLRKRLPESLALLLVFALARKGRAQAPAWGVAAAVAATLAVGTGVALAAPGASVAGPVDSSRVAIETPVSPVVGSGLEVLATGTSRQPVAPANGLSVRVLDAAGRPLPAVAVELAPAAGLEARVLARRVVTSGDGLAVFPVPAGSSWRVRTDRGHDQVVEVLAPEQGLELRAVAALAVRGRVADPAGAPIVGAAIWLAPPDADPLDGMEVSTSDAEGRFQLAAVPRGAQLTARSPRFAAPVPIVLADEREVVFVLDRAGGQVQGTVLDDRGAPVADALVLVGPGADGPNAVVAPNLKARQAPPCWLTTDANGRFCSAALGEGRQPLVVRKAGFAACRLDVVPVAGRTVDVVCALQRATRLFGCVRDAAGAPQSGVRIYVRSEATHASCDLVSDANGCFESSVLPAGHTDVTVRAHGCAVVERSLRLEPGAVELPLVVAPLPELRGRAVHADGSPLAGWSLAVPAATDRAHECEAFAEPVAADGTVRLRVHPGSLPSHMVLQATDDGPWHHVGDLVELHSDGSFVLRLPADREPTARLVCRLLDAAVRPIAGAVVHAALPGQRWWRLGTTDAAGELTVASLPPGDYALRTEAPHGGQPALEQTAVALRSGHTHHEELRAAPTGEVRYRVWRSDGSLPLAPIVSFERVGADTRCAFLYGATGCQVLTPGTYDVYVTGEDFVWANGRVVVEAGQVVQFERELRPAWRRYLSLHELPDACRGERLDGTLCDATTGEVLYRFQVGADGGPMLPLRSYLPSGAIRLHARSEKGIEVVAEFTLPAAEEDTRPRQLPFQLVR